MALLRYQKGAWHKAALAGTFTRDVFICCPGPSLVDVDSQSLHVPGATVLAVNTAYPHIRPHVWIGLDTVECYDPRLWQEPFIKVLRGGYQEQRHGGIPIGVYPNVHFADLQQGELSCLFEDAGDDVRLLWQKNTFMAAVHLALHLGGRRLWLVGCDFGGERDYHDDRVLSDANRRENRLLYDSLVSQMPKLRNLAEKHGVVITSCTPDSPANQHLPYRSLERALETVQPEEAHSGVVCCRDVKHCTWPKLELTDANRQGVLVGTDTGHEWMLAWWYECFRQHNEKLPVAFADYGMSDKAKQWCQQRGQVVDVTDVEPPGNHVWYRKPFAIIRTPFLKTVYLDLDCEVSGDIKPMFLYCGRLGKGPRKAVGLRFDWPFMNNPGWQEWLLPGELMYQAGVIVYEHGTKLIEEWSRKVLSGEILVRSDQEVLGRMIHLTEAPVVNLPARYNNIMGLTPPLDNAVIRHWVGNPGKDHIRKQIAQQQTGAMRRPIPNGHLGGFIHGGDPWTWEPAVWSDAIQQLGIKTVADVGCGEGQTAKWFAEHGCAVIAIDGSQKAIEHAVYPIVQHDYTQGPLALAAVDLVYACEFVEHVAEEHLDNVLATFRAGNHLLMTFADSPAGHHHVNVQPEGYWVEQMARIGFELDTELTTHVRKLAQQKHMRERGLFFHKTEGKG